jgi:uncharacterized membrane protein YeiH
MGYNVELPVIKERINWGNDIVGFVVLDITTQMPGGTSRQREIRLGITPLQFEITHHFGQILKFGLSIFNFAIRSEIQYGKLETI